MAATQTVNDNILFATVQKAWESAPPEVKAAFPNFLSAGANLVNVCALHANTIEPVNTVLHYLDPANVCNLQAAQHYVQQANNNTGVVAHSEVLVDCMSSNAAAPEHVTADIKSGLRSTANTLLITSTLCAAVQVLMSVVNLWELHESVKDAQNLTKSSKIKLGMISKKVKLVPGKLAELDNILKELNQPDLLMKQVASLSNKANIIKSAIDVQLRGIVREIDNLELEINSRKVRVGAARKQAYMAGIGSLVSGVTTSVSVGLLIGVANPIVLGIAGVVAACNLVLGVGCPVYAYITYKELEEIQARLDHISEVKVKVEELEMKLMEQVDLLYDRIDELTN